MPPLNQHCTDNDDIHRHACKLVSAWTVTTKIQQLLSQHQGIYHYIYVVLQECMEHTALNLQQFPWEKLINPGGKIRKEVHDSKASHPNASTRLVQYLVQKVEATLHNMSGQLMDIDYQQVIRRGSEMH